MLVSCDKHFVPLQFDGQDMFCPACQYVEVQESEYEQSHFDGIYTFDPPKRKVEPELTYRYTIIIGMFK